MEDSTAKLILPWHCILTEDHPFQFDLQEIASPNPEIVVGNFNVRLR